MHEVMLSEYGTMSAQPSPVSRMMASFAADFRDDVDINLGVGYVNEETIPSSYIQEAMAEVLRDPRKYRQPLNYGGPEGSPNLIESIRRYHLAQGVGGLDEDTLSKLRIIIGSSGATSILEGLAHVLPRGIVLTADPVYYIYTNTLDRLGFEVVAVPEDEEGIDTDALRKRIADLGERRNEIRFIYVVTVGNPTCTVISNARRRDLVAVAVELSRDLGRKIPLILDKAYEDLIHDPAVERPESALLHDELGICYEVGTVSKILAPALRIGYMMGRDSDLMRALVQRCSDVGFSASLLMQDVASYMLDRRIASQVRGVNRGYREKARAVRGLIGRYLGGTLEQVTGGSASFYFYLTLNVETHERSGFFRFLSRTTGDERIDGPSGAKRARVVYVPGEHFVHPGGELVGLGRRQLRVSYGYETLGNIEVGLRLMGEAAEYARGRL